MVSILHQVLGTEPFAVIGAYNGKTEEQIKIHVRSALGRDYALGGLVSLEQLGLLEFPVNQTHKVMKDEIMRAVDVFLRAKQHGMEKRASQEKGRAVSNNHWTPPAT